MHRPIRNRTIKQETTDSRIVNEERESRQNYQMDDHSNLRESDRAAAEPQLWKTDLALSTGP